MKRVLPAMVVLVGAVLPGAGDAAPALVATVPVGTTPRSVAVDPVRDVIYAPGPGGNALAVISGATNQRTATIPLPGEAHGIAVNTATRRVYVTHQAPSQVSVINAVSNALIATVPLAAFTHPNGIAVDEARNRIYTVSEAAGVLIVINGASNTITTTVPVGNYPRNVALNATTNKIYVAVGGDSRVRSFSAVTYAPLGTVQFAGSEPFGLAINESTNRIYVGRLGNSVVSVIRGDTDQLVTDVYAGPDPYGVAVNPVTNRIYASNRSSTTIAVIDGDQDVMLTSLDLGPFSYPYGVALNVQTFRVYAARFGAGDIAVLTEDDVPPTAGGPPNQYVYLSGETIIGNAFDDLSGVATVYVSMRNLDLPFVSVTSGPAQVSCNDGTRRVCQWSVQAPLYPGRYELSVSSNDRAGNVQTWPSGGQLLIV